MLTKTTTAPTMVFARVAYKTAAWLVTGVNCPHCARKLKATDVRADYGQAQLTCAGCHRDILIIESES
jgi:hypothetical protein